MVISTKTFHVSFVRMTGFVQLADIRLTGSCVLVVRYGVRVFIYSVLSSDRHRIARRSVLHYDERLLII